MFKDVPTAKVTTQLAPSSATLKPKAFVHSSQPLFPALFDLSGFVPLWLNFKSWVGFWFGSLSLRLLICDSFVCGSKPMVGAAAILEPILVIGMFTGGIGMGF